MRKRVLSLLLAMCLALSLLPARALAAEMDPDSTGSLPSVAASTTPQAEEAFTEEDAFQEAALAEETATSGTFEEKNRLVTGGGDADHQRHGPYGRLLCNIRSVV